jgi:RNA polymerase sigma-70 factor (ECF subfamily)
MEQTLNSQTPQPGHAFVQANIATYDGELRRYVAKRAPPVAVDDLVQQVWERLCRVKNPSRIKEPLAYIYRVARGVLADYFEAHSKTAGGSVHTCVEGLTDTSPGEKICGSLLDDLLAQNAVEWILRNLRPRYREILVLRNLCNFSYATIGAILGFTPGSTEQYYYDAMLEAKSLLEQFDSEARPDDSYVDGPSLKGADK